MDEHETRLAALAAQIGAHIPGLLSEIACVHGYTGPCVNCIYRGRLAAQMNAAVNEQQLARERADKRAEQFYDEATHWRIHRTAEQKARMFGYRPEHVSQRMHEEHERKLALQAWSPTGRTPEAQAERDRECERERAKPINFVLPPRGGGAAPGINVTVGGTNTGGSIWSAGERRPVTIDGKFVGYAVHNARAGGGAAPVTPRGDKAEPLYGDGTIWCHVCDRVAYHMINIPHVCDDGVMRTLVPHTLEILCEDGVMRAAISNTREIK